jgi:rRNA maturation protein Nop10
MSPIFPDGSEFIDPVACAKCGSNAYMIWRIPQTDTAEIQTFQCPGCGHETKRTVPPQAASVGEPNGPATAGSGADIAANRL